MSGKAQDVELKRAESVETGSSSSPIDEDVEIISEKDVNELLEERSDSHSEMEIGDKAKAEEEKVDEEEEEVDNEVEDDYAEDEEYDEDDAIEEEKEAGKVEELVEKPFEPEGIPDVQKAVPDVPFIPYKSDFEELSEEQCEQIFPEEFRTNAYTNLIIGSILMFTLPFAAMFISYQFVFEGHYHLPIDQAYLYSGIVGVAVVYALILGFIWIAYREEKQIEGRFNEVKKIQ